MDKLVKITWTQTGAIAYRLRWKRDVDNSYPDDPAYLAIVPQNENTSDLSYTITIDTDSNWTYSIQPVCVYNYGEPVEGFIKTMPDCVAADVQAILYYCFARPLILFTNLLNVNSNHFAFQLQFKATDETEWTNGPIIFNEPVLLLPAKSFLNTNQYGKVINYRVVTYCESPTADNGLIGPTHSITNLDFNISIDNTNESEDLIKIIWTPVGEIGFICSINGQEYNSPNSGAGFLYILWTALTEAENVIKVTLLFANNQECISDVITIQACGSCANRFFYAKIERGDQEFGYPVQGIDISGSVLLSNETLVWELRNARNGLVYDTGTILPGESLVVQPTFSIQDNTTPQLLAWKTVCTFSNCTKESEYVLSEPFTYRLL